MRRIMHNVVPILLVFCAFSLAAQNQIIIPLDDYKTEAALTLLPSAKSRGWDNNRLESSARTVFREKHPLTQVDIACIVFGPYYTGTGESIPLTALATVNIRPLTFISEADLKGIADQLVKNDSGAQDAYGKVELQKGRARNLVPLLLPALRRAKPEEQNLAFAALEEIGPYAADAISILIDKIAQSGDTQKGTYIAHLGHIGPAAIPALIKVLREAPNAYTKKDAALALCTIKPVGLSFVRTALSDNDATLRAASASALGRVKEAADIPRLILLLDDAANEVVQAAADSLAVFGPAAGAAVPRLVNLLTDPSRQQHWPELDALARVHCNPQLILPNLRPIFAAVNAANISAALRVVAAFAPSSSEFAPEAIKALDHRYTQSAAIEALTAIGGKPASIAAPKLIALAASKDYAEPELDALFAIGPDAVEVAPQLRALLKQKNRSDSLNIARVIGAIGPSQRPFMPNLIPLATANYGSLSQAPDFLLRIFASWDVDAAIALLQREAQKPDPDFFGQHFRQSKDAVGRLQEMKAQIARVSAAASAPTESALPQTDPSIDARWARVLRPGDSITRAVALLGQPARANSSHLIYHNIIADPRTMQSLPRLIVQIDSGKIKSLDFD